MNHPEDRTKHVEEWLDAALERYSNAEPHPALELRILASLQAQRERTVRWWAWGMALAVAAAVLLIAVTAGLMQRKERGPMAVKTAPQETGAVSASVANSDSQGAAKSGSNPRTNFGTSRAAWRAGERNKEVETISISASRQQDEPRLAQFPSSRPDSEQARLLTAYLQNVPAGEVVAVAAAANSTRDLAISDLSVAPLDRQAENSKEEK